MNKKCQFYIVIAVLNGRQTIERCFDSVLRQTYSRCKILVVDGGSDDGTVEIIQRYQSDLAWWVSEPDQGIYDAWNKALARVEEGWVLFLGADDVLQSQDVLAIAAQHLQQVSTDVMVAYGQVNVVNDRGITLMVKGEPWELSGRHFASGMTLGHQGVFHHVSLFKKYGFFNPSFKIAGDYELLLRVLLTNPPLYMDNLVVASWCIGGLSYNVNTPLLVAREFSVARRINGIRGFSSYLAVFYLKAYVLRCLSIVFGERFANMFAALYRKLTGQWAWS